MRSDAVRKDTTGLPYVLVNNDGKVKEISIKTGLQGAGTTEIVAGLNPGDRVILPGALLQAGDRVREHAASTPRGNVQPVTGLTN